MKTSTISCMVIGMMILGTTTSFGKTNNQPRQNNQPRKEVRVNNDRNQSPRPEMDKRNQGPRPEMEKPMPKPHRHEFGRNHECKICHFTEHQIHMMEKDMHKPVPMDHNRH